jgi:hypothetical protein
MELWRLLAGRSEGLLNIAFLLLLQHLVVFGELDVYRDNVWIELRRQLKGLAAVGLAIDLKLLSVFEYRSQATVQHLQTDVDLSALRVVQTPGDLLRLDSEHLRCKICDPPFPSATRRAPTGRSPDRAGRLP